MDGTRAEESLRINSTFRWNSALHRRPPRGSAPALREHLTASGGLGIHLDRRPWRRRAHGSEHASTRWGPASSRSWRRADASGARSVFRRRNRRRSKWMPGPPLHMCCVLCCRDNSRGVIPAKDPPDRTAYRISSITWTGPSGKISPTPTANSRLRNAYCDAAVSNRGSVRK